MSIVADDFDQICLPLGDRNVWTLGFRSEPERMDPSVPKKSSTFTNIYYTHGKTNLQGLAVNVH